MTLVGESWLNWFSRIGDDFEFEPHQQWMKRHWHWSIVVAVAYAILIWVGQRYMKNRAAYSLRWYLVGWNLLLAIFSMIGTYYVVPETISIIKSDGYVGSLCSVGNQYKGKIGFWTYLFLLSKVPELLDTVFLVLRKRPVILLHSYHHASILVFCFYQYQFLCAPARWGPTMNLVVHSIMYTYYAIRAAGIVTPMIVPILITTLQIVQMIHGTTVSILVLAFVTFGKRPSCIHNSSVAIFQCFIFITYLILFVKFFIDTYIAKRPRRRNKEE